MEEKKISRIIILIIFISAVIRSFFAATVDLGNDEVYYNLYSLYPDWSHFDHPPMVGWMIRLFTFNNLLDSVFFIRFASIVLGSVSCWVIYKITKLYGSPRSGLLAVLLYISSIYCSIIAGVFILPDTPQIFFWLLAVYYFSLSFINSERSRYKDLNFLLAGIFTGLAILSKYTSVFIWIGVILFIVFHRKEWLKKPITYISILISLILQLPVLWWNLQNHFISFTYQGNRVSGLSRIRFDYFFTEILGEFFYNNPVNFILIISSMLLVFYFKRIKLPSDTCFILYLSFPLILIFWILSLFHSTLPHWTGPAFTTLVIFTAVIYDKWTTVRKLSRFIPKAFKISLYSSALFVIICYFQITTGVLTRILVPARNKVENVSWDISLDMYGWKQLRDAMPGLYETDLQQGRILKDPFLLSWRWFPAANLDYYVAMPMGLKLFAFGKLEQIHKYYWINKIRGPMPYGKDAYFICTNRDKKDPEKLFRDHFCEYSLPDTLPVYRCGRQVMEFYIYRLHHYQKAQFLTKSFSEGRPTR